MLEIYVSTDVENAESLRINSVSPLIGAGSLCDNQ